MLLTLALMLLICHSPVLADDDQLVYELGNFPLEAGATLPSAKLSYTTHGTLNAAGDNAILLPSFYLGDHHGYDFLIGPGKALNPDRYFIIATDMFLNGLSSSPSNTPPPFSGPDFPAISIRDNIAAQRQLLTTHLGISQLQAVIGFSMGAQQAFQWAVSHPEFVASIVPMCGSAVEHPHGVARLESFKLAITTDANFKNGRYETPPEAGLRSAAVHWSAWGTSQEWFRREAWQELGLSNLVGVYEFYFALMNSWDANNLLALAETWQSNNVGTTMGFAGDYRKALAAISASVLYMPCETDLYFHIDALAHESQFISDVQFLPIPSDWGHLAGGGFAAEDAAFINQAVREFLER
jgi:homoserine O-acetyltransferase/O-succinyltransferase